jgi:hypothetical protein
VQHCVKNLPLDANNEGPLPVGGIADRSLSMMIENMIEDMIEKEKQ